MRRGSGILLHITSLPSPHGIGDFGPWAYKFADFLAETGQSFWQILPLNPTDPVYSNSPYLSTSAFAINPLLISPEFMVRDGLLDKGDVETPCNWPKGRVDYDAVIAYKSTLFHLAYKRFKRAISRYEYEKFCSEHSNWIEDFALFVALKAHFNGQIWSEWPHEIRDRQPDAVRSLKKELHKRIEMEKFLQYVAFRQWIALKKYCNQRGIHLIGDIPIYVEYQSAECWTNPEVFKLDEGKRPYVVAGVPPDYFSETGQLWGNPVYQWDALKKSGYDWWVQRIKHNVTLFDFVRVDHFRGFVAYWEVPATEQTAVNGRWVEAPAADFFTHLTKKFPCLPIIAEDLGLITPDVREIIQRFEFPGMKLLLFAFGEDMPANPYIPHNLEKNCVVYTGTHDNNTVRGWVESEATPEEKERLFQYLGRDIPAGELHWDMIRLAMMSVANVAIIPMQDILGLGEDARMNLPATTDGNWRWQLVPGQLTPSLADRLLKITEIYGRA
ncbi:MAG: 4-alpha-glucanotransferase [Deltaproteobacteria bacterium]|nr:4-alpha-glucanotransferase [Deltaproteobacteria bacterium]